ncbi:MAG: NAD(P)/FAD-dependent oxidoreductase [Pseudorhodobacter sp.]
MPGPPVVPVRGDETLPDRVDTVVIGGGIVGTSTALELAERGQRVALCEKGGIAQEQSSRNWGWVRITRRDEREIPLMAEALRIWDGLAERTGRDPGFKRAGLAFACADEAEFARHERWAEHLRPYQIESRVIRGADFDKAYPGCKAPPYGVLYTPFDGRAEPQKAAPAIAEAARDRGAAVLTSCAVRGVETAAGKVSGVVTERGRIACDAVVLAGGAWSRLFSGNLGIDLPQLKIMNTVLRTEPLEGGPESALWTPDFAFRKRQDGGYTIANGYQNIVDIVPDSFRLALKFLPALRHEWRDLRPRIGARFREEASHARKWSLDEVTVFERRRVLDPVPHQSSIQSALKRVAEDFPIFAKAQVAQSWAGLIDVTPDAVPVICGIDRVPGFFIATGFSGHGFGIGPGAGRLTADLVTGATPCVDPEPFRLGRFFDGTAMEIDKGY